MILLRSETPSEAHRECLKAAGLTTFALVLLLATPSVSATPLPRQDVGITQAAPPATGSYKWATLLCKFSNVSDEPHDRAWFDGLMGMEYPGLGHYWAEQSYGQLDLGGSQAYGWFMLPGTRSSYGTYPNMDFQKLAADCVAAADAQVNFREFQGVNVMLNADIGIAGGGQGSFDVDGENTTFGTTWQGSSGGQGMEGYDRQSIVASEMQHALGIPWHSSGPYDQTYDSYWDVGSVPGATCPNREGTYGCIGQHTIAYHKDVLGWIPDTRRFEAPEGTTTVKLQALDTMPGSDFLWAKVPTAGSATQFYSVEVRRQHGYDVALPTASTVILHKVDLSVPDGGRRARVVDATNDENPNDEGAMWRAGETFKDDSGGVAIEILAGPAEDGSYQVRITAPVGAEAAASILDASIIEGDSGTKAMRFEIVLSPAPTERVTLSYATKPGKAKSGKDFSPTSGDLAFTAGERSDTVTVRIKGDRRAESNEIFTLVLSAGPDVELVDKTAKGKIRDND